jgi:hypothetical protein
MKEGDWAYERWKLFVQVYAALVIAFAALLAFYFARAVFDLVSVGALALLVILSLILALYNFQQAKINENTRFWQRFFTLKLGQIENELFLDPSTGLGASIERVDAYQSADWNESNTRVTDARMVEIICGAEGETPQNNLRNDLMDRVTQFTYISIWIWLGMAAAICLYSVIVVSNKSASFTWV